MVPKNARDATIEKEWLVDELPDLKLAYLNIYGLRLEIVASTEAKAGMPIASDLQDHL